MTPKISFLVPVLLGYGNQDTKAHVYKLIRSIASQSLEEYEILFCGNYCPDQPKCKFIQHSGEPKGHITHVLNLLVKNAQSENLVFLRDYNFLYPHFTEGFFTEDREWDLMQVCQLNQDLTRYRDWTSWCDNEVNPGITVQKEPWCEQGLVWHGHPHLEPYSHNKIHTHYISLAVWCAKKSFMQKFPLDEKLFWGQAEDVEWSKRALMENQDARYIMNRQCVTGMSKYKDRILPVKNPYHGTLAYVLEECLPSIKEIRCTNESNGN